MTDLFILLLIAIPALPLAAAVITALVGPFTQRLHPLLPSVPVVAGIMLSCLCSLILLTEVMQGQAELDASESAAEGQCFERAVTLWTWASVPQDAEPVVRGAAGPMSNFVVDITLRADALTAMMLAMVTFVGSLVAVYAVGYMQGDRGFWRFFAYVGLFVFSMTMLVAASNFLLLFVFWEAVGLCSYLLIGFWYEKPEAAAAGKKAFLVNRVGDFAFLLGVFLIWTYYGTLNFHTPGQDGHTAVVWSAEEAEGVAAPANTVEGMFSHDRITAADYKQQEFPWLVPAICTLLMLGACGKSAQFPLHVWLPDAMEGPTPVSALIHAATMVTAGVYMVVRCTPLFVISPETQLLVAVIGGVTALLAALIALTQFDLKRVLAYSTISQLGYMFLALGVGSLAGITSGMFHLFTHAFFKALLFLGAGSVMHAMGNVIDMRRFGGLRRIMPITHWTFLIGSLALAGVPPFAGFWSKDSIVGAVHDKVHELLHHDGEHAGAINHPVQVPDDAPKPPEFTLLDAEVAGRVFQVLYWAALATALLTAFYTFRAYFMTFCGELRVPAEAGDHAHESPLPMTAPLVILAIGAFLVGMVFDRSYIDGAGNLFASFLAGAPSLGLGAVSLTTQPGEFHFDVAALSTLVAFCGIGLAAYFYLGESQQIDRLASLLNFEWLIRLADPQTVSALQRIGWIGWIKRTAQSIGLGWLVSLLGYAILLILLLLATPLWIGYYISPYRLSRDKFYLDEVYQWVIVAPLRFAAAVSYWIDRWVIDGLVNTIGRIPVWIGSLMRSLQMGLVQFYALAMALGVLILITARMLFAG
ncbi:MAG: NADH-quinone oxidoreductase subunit L [Pirellulaceae bacterium]